MILKVRILQFLTTFTQLTARLKNFLRDWLLALSIKEGLEGSTFQMNHTYIHDIQLVLLLCAFILKANILSILIILCRLMAFNIAIYSRYSRVVTDFLPYPKFRESLLSWWRIRSVFLCFQYNQCAGPQKQEVINGHSSTIVWQNIKVKEYFK